MTSLTPLCRKQLRDYCWDLIHDQNPSIPIEKLKQTRDDPLINPQLYLTKRMRAALWTKYGIKPYPLYQYEGDFILIPAGFVSLLSACSLGADGGRPAGARTKSAAGSTT